MARRAKHKQGDDDDMEAEWPMIDSYTTKDGFFVKVFKTAYAVAGSNKYSVRPKGVHI